MKKSEDPIESIFERLDNQWDTELPNFGHADRFMEKLNRQPVQKKKNNWKLFAIAASLFLTAGLITFYQYTNKPVDQWENASVQTKETHDYFASVVEKELAVLKATNQAKITELEEKGKTLQTDLDKKIAETQPIIDGFDGLMARINALGDLPWLPSFFIMLLFLAIETSPIIAKLLSPKGEYDFKIEDTEMATINVLAQNKHQSELQRKTDAEIYNQVYSDIKTDKELYDYKKQRATELLKLQADGFVEKQKKAL